MSRRGMERDTTLRRPGSALNEYFEGIMLWCHECCVGGSGGKMLPGRFGRIRTT